MKALPDRKIFSVYLDILKCNISIKEILKQVYFDIEDSLEDKDIEVFEDHFAYEYFNFLRQHSLRNIKYGTTREPCNTSTIFYTFF